jgi:hypothetical protein
MQKTVVWRPKQAPALGAHPFFSAFSVPGLDGIELLGAPISRSADYTTTLVTKRVSKCVDDIKLIMSNNFTPQISLLLLRSCLGMTKLNYTWRTTHPSLLTEPSSELEATIVDALRQIVVAKGPRFGKFQTSLASLPASLGGIGIPLPSQIRHFAFVASFMGSRSVQQEIISTLPVHLPPSLVELTDSYYSVCHQNRIEDIKKELLLPHNKLQHIMAEGFFSNLRDSLRASLHSTLLPGDRIEDKLTAFDSMCEPLAYQWLFVMPNVGLHQVMNPKEYRAALALRLLIPILPNPMPCPAERCKCTLDRYGYHTLACNGVGNLRKRRHDIVRDALFDIALAADFRPRKDADIQVPDDRGHMLRPGDLVVEGDDYLQTCVDVTVVAPIKKKIPHSAVGVDVQLAEDYKIAKNFLACERSHFGFLPFAVDVFGGVGSKSEAFLRRLSFAWAAVSAFPISYISSLSKRKVSFAIQLGIARQLTPRVIESGPSVDFV